MNNLQPLREGIVRDEDTGVLYLPSTRRADGTWRKPIRIKEGYIPQEEMPIFESIGSKFAKSIPKGPVGLAPSAVSKSKSNVEGLSKAAKKNLRRKEKKKEVTGTMSAPSLSSFSAAKERVADKTAEIRSGPVTGDEVERVIDEKRVKALRKKLRQIEKLSDDIQDGHIAKPDPDQVSKVDGKPAVEDELNTLLVKLRLS